MAVTVLCAVRGPEETAVVVALGAQASGATVTRRCGDLSELLAAAAAGAGTVAVVSADLPGLDREAVGRLYQAGVRIVALPDAGVPVERLRAMGIDTVLERFDEDALLAAVRDARPLTAPAEPGPAPVGAVTGEPVAGEPAGAEDDVPVAVGTPGTVVAVWGPVGAPGRTTTATELAAAVAGVGGRAVRRRVRRGGEAPEAPTASALLVDADTYGSSLAARLGMLDDAPGLAAVARAAGQGTLDLPSLARHSPLLAPRLRVLTGITRAARWPELPASALEVVLERARELVDVTVVDCGPMIEADELLMYDTHAPQRNAATLAALQAADIVVVVGSADPIGVQRLVRGLEDLREAPVPVGGQLVVVANRVRASAVGPDPERAVREALARYAGVEDVHTVPDDAAALDAAVLAGRTLAEQAPSSPARAAFAALAERVRAVVPQPA